MKLCEYGCGQKGKYYQTNGKLCCSKFYTQCPEIRRKNKEGNIGRKQTDETKNLIRKSKLGKLNPNYGKYGELNPFFGKRHTKENKKKMAVNKFTIKKIKKKYPFFSRVEEMRYNPDKPDEKEIQVHCKNHKCKNSKEKGGWFTPTKTQLYERMRHLEKEYGNGGCYFYCCDRCKITCPLYNYNTRGEEINQEIIVPYSEIEIQIWRQIVLEQDKHQCQKCGSNKNLHCHHIVPVKENPMLALDPDNGIVLCQNCHYEIGHRTNTECSTGNLAKQVRCNLGG